jgi:hypothetical protein
MNNIDSAFRTLHEFKGESFPETIATIERAFIGSRMPVVTSLLEKHSLSQILLEAAFQVKRASSQIDELIHAVGILTALPRILSEDEVICTLSLAAGNTGKDYDLETNKRIAEFTFIEWQGGAEVIRQNKIFKDFYFLAESECALMKELYVIGTEFPIKFFRSGRALPSILKNNARLGNSFTSKYGARYKTVREYYEERKDRVAIKDVRDYISIPE